MSLPLAILAASIVASSAATATTPANDLEAWASLGGSPPVGMSAIRFHGPQLHRLAPGVYRIDVQAVRDMPFHLYGPGLNRKTPFSLSATDTSTVYARWKVRFKPGRYRYEAWGVYAKALRDEGLKASGSFVVR